ncbi:coil containing protein [Vibrio phage 2.275.O._10N.286.54.E11]|nr:coil containing protein [Vibrio phage 2.275.O._10N.286.54.E11]
MRLNVFADGMELTEALEASVNQHLDKLGVLEEFVGDAHLDVTLRVNKQNNVCEAKIRTHKKDHFVKVVRDNMYDAIEEMSHDLKRQLRKTKEKIQERGKHLEMPPLMEAPLDTDDELLFEQWDDSNE